MGVFLGVFICLFVLLLEFFFYISLERWLFLSRVIDLFVVCGEVRFVNLEIIRFRGIVYGIRVF